MVILEQCRQDSSLPLELLINGPQVTCGRRCGAGGKEMSAWTAAGSAVSAALGGLARWRSRQAVLLVGQPPSAPSHLEVDPPPSAPRGPSRV